MAEPITLVLAALLTTGFVVFGDPSDPGSWVFVAGTLTMWVLRTVYSKARKIPVAEQRVDRTEKLVLVGASLGFMVLPWASLMVPWPASLVAPVSLAAVVAGAVIFAAADLLFWRSHVDLGRQWSPTLELKEDHALVTTGVYRWIRHPMYSSLWLMAGAQALVLPHRIAAISALIGFGLLYVTRIGREEAMMADRFGEAWTRYVAGTGRFVPSPARIRQALQG